MGLFDFDSARVFFAIFDLAAYLLFAAALFPLMLLGARIRADACGWATLLDRTLVVATFSWPIGLVLLVASLADGENVAAMLRIASLVAPVSFVLGACLFVVRLFRKPPLSHVAVRLLVAGIVVAQCAYGFWIAPSLTD